MRKFEESIIAEILEKYDNGQSITSLNKEYHTTQVRELLIANDRKVPESRKGCGGAKRKYTLNEDYFENLDSKDKAYFLGFIYADGFITRGRTHGQDILGITLAEPEPIEKFKKYINCDKPIGVYKKTNSYSDKSIEYKLACISNKLVSDIEKLGVVERKTFLITFPDWMRPDLIPHFIRGYFDGDGSVFYHKNDIGNTMLGINICGTKQFLEGMIRHFAFVDDNIIYKEKRRETDCWNIKMTSNMRSLELYHYMYKDCDDLYLSRKREKFENFIKEKDSTTIITNPTKEFIGYKEYLNLCYLED